MAKVGVLGARGRMGREVVRTVTEAPDLEVGAEVDQGDALDALTGCDVVVDFTHPGVVMSNLHWCVRHDADVVVGTSGFGEDRLGEVRDWLPEHPGRARPGRAELLRRRHLDDAVRRPGGQVLPLRRGDRAAPREQGRRPVRHRAAHRVDDQRDQGRAGLGPPPDATASALPGARGASVDGVHVHSVRVAGLVAHQEVLFGGTGETLTIRHDSLDRVSFMPGVLLAVRGIGSLPPGLTVGLEGLLGLE